MDETHRDPMNPRAERAWLAKVGEIFERRHEGVLEDVHGVVTRSEETRRQPKNGRRIATIQELFGSVVAFARPENQPSVVLRSRCIFVGGLQRSRAGGICIRQGSRENAHDPRV